MRVKVWAMRTGPGSDREADLLMTNLPITLRDRLQTKAEAPRLQSLWAYSLLRFAVHTTWRIDLPELAWSAAGKPRFARREDLFFSVSHTDGAVMVGLAHREIGVDLEKDREAPVRLQRFCQTGDPFFSVWVQWEAAAKCLGQPVLSVLRKGVLPSEITCCPVETFSGYWACAAMAGEDVMLDVERISRERVLAFCAEKA